MNQVTNPANGALQVAERRRALLAELERETQAAIDLLQVHLERFLKAGDVVSRSGMEHTANLRVTQGNGRGALQFELVRAPRVLLSPANWLSEASWVAKAFPLNAQGKRMSGRTHSTGQDDAVTIEAPLFPFMDITSDGLSGDEYRKFSNEYVQHWLASSPDTYKPLRQSSTA